MTYLAALMRPPSSVWLVGARARSRALSLPLSLPLSLALSLPLFLPLFLPLGAGCGADETADGQEEEAPGPPERTCFPPDGHDGSPESMAEVVALLNALPKPVTVACLLETLDRPLGIEASDDNFSFQPAFGPANPRMFVFSGPLVITVVPKGSGSAVVEFSEARGPGRTVKGELPFPVVGEVPLAAPFDRVLDGSGGGTKCAVCHLSEAADNEIDFAEAYVSELLRPSRLHLVEIDAVRSQFEDCDRVAEPARCAVFDAIFAYGEVVHRPFDPPEGAEPPEGG
jgi:hypothetical protein